MTIQQEIQAGDATVFAGRTASGDENYGIYTGTLTQQECIAGDPGIWQADEDGFVDYDLYNHDAVNLHPGQYTLSFTSSESGDHFFDLIEGHIADLRVLRAYAMVDMEDWWGYEEKIVDPDLGVDDYDDGPNLDEAILLTVI